MYVDNNIRMCEYHWRQALWAELVDVKSSTVKNKGEEPRVHKQVQTVHRQERLRHNKDKQKHWGCKTNTFLTANKVGKP